jgi:hypothetical protein
MPKDNKNYRFPKEDKATLHVETFLLDVQLHIISAEVKLSHHIVCRQMIVGYKQPKQ